MKTGVNYQALSYSLMTSILLLSTLGLLVFFTKTIYIDNTGQIGQFADTIASTSDFTIIFITRQQIIYLFLFFQTTFTFIFYFLFCKILKKNDINMQ